MYLSIRKFSGAADRDEVVRQVEEGLVPQLREHTGFVAYYAVEFDDGDLGSVIVFESKEHADSSMEQSLGWLKENLSELLPNEPQVHRGEVLIHEAAKSLGKSA